MKLDFMRTAARSYMIVKDFSYSYEEFELQMLLNNHIPGLLELQVICGNGSFEYWYDVTGMISMELMLGTEPPGQKELAGYIRQICDTRILLEKYFLDADDLLYRPSMLYLNKASGRLQFCCIPGYHKERENGLKSFMEEVLKCADHSDPQTVRSMYAVYEQCANPDVRMEDLLALVSDPAKEPNRTDPGICAGTPETMYAGACAGIPETAHEEVSAGRMKAGETGVRNRMPEAMNPGVASGRTKAADPGACTGMPAAPDFTKDSGDSRRKGFADYADLLDHMDLSYEEDALFERKTGRQARRAKKETSLFAPADSAGQRDKKRGRQKAVGLFKREKGDRQKPEYRQPDPQEDIWPGYIEPAYESPSDGATVLLEPARMRTCYRLLYCGNGHEPDLCLDRFPYTIGKNRQQADGVLTSETVSRIHARIHAADGEYLLEDLDSTNGTYINGTILPPRTPAPLHVNDRVTFGGEEFVLNESFRPETSFPEAAMAGAVS